ncbi:MAG: rsuA [Parcubacteria group bacterium]|nr:rsuA [Parcubacteria group bacterium]
MKDTKPPQSIEAVFPMRINKFLAHKGHATRREADTIIEKGQVFLNGVKAKLGDKVLETDTVEVKGRAPKSYVYLAFHKPKDLITQSEEKGEKDVLDMLPSDLKRLKLFPLGRLDKASSGLLLLTNDGRITDRLLNPAYDHEKTYEVTTKMPLRASFAEYMEKGVDIEGYLTKASKVEVLADQRFRITITEGKKHQIRRMVVAMHNEVQDLRRVRIMNIELGKLAPGAYRRLDGKELAIFLESLGL